MSAESEQSRKIFVGGLNYKTTEEGLRIFYGQWGELSDCVVMTDKESGKSRGFGFVTYTHPSMVDEAMKNRPHSIDGRQVQTKRAVARDQAHTLGANSSVTKIFIGGIRDKPITKEHLEAYFGVFGEIKECMMITEKETGKPRGFAFVQFVDYDPVDKITMQKFHQIDGVSIEVKKAIPKDCIAPSRGSFRGQRGGSGGYGGSIQESGPPGGFGGSRGGFRGGRGSSFGGATNSREYGGGDGGYGQRLNAPACYGAANADFEGYGVYPHQQQHRGGFRGNLMQTNTAYGFGGWGGGANTNSKDAIDATNSVAYLHLGQYYGQSQGGGAVTRGGGPSMRGGGPSKSAGVIGAGRPKPYSGGGGGRNF